MRSALRCLAVLSVLPAAAAWFPEAALGQLSVEGAWIAAEWTVDGESSESQRGMFVFTTTHYSFFFVNQAEPRAVQAESGPGSITEAETLVAYGEFTANAGIYTLEGDVLTTQAYVAKSPDYMSGWPDNPSEYTVTRTGDAMTLTFGNGNVAHLERVEGRHPGQ